jgi:DMSO/TMAO reductase YedYZ molybdopterin-dependent catalytic subunit
MGNKNRLPPGQVLTQRFPVLHYGAVPRYVNMDEWDLRVFGAVEDEVRFTYAKFTSLPTVRIVADIHCVTRWSKFDMVWEGVRFRTLLDHVRPLPGAQYVIVHGEHDFTANLPLAALLADDALLAWKYDDALLTPEHGWPLRLVAPQSYFWKSAKWVRGIEFALEDRPGFWEQAGYHNEGDPWKEQRYAT